MIERMRRILLAIRNGAKGTMPVMVKIAKAVLILPAHACRSVTFDRGSAFVNWSSLQAETGAQAWFHKAQSPWPEGAAINTNPRLRR